MGAVQEISDATFDAEVLKSTQPVLVDFWAPWCGPCRMLAPVVEAVGQKYADKMKTVKINTDENQQAATTYQVTGIPCLILFKNGSEATRFVGFRPQPALEADLLAHL